VVLVFTFTINIFTTVACSSEQEVQNISPLDLQDKGNPKLDSQLNQLISAESHGEAVSFAEQSNIELVDGAVRVIIECIPGQIEVAKKTVTDSNATLETSHDNLLQVIVPIIDLTDLAGEESIKFIRLPLVSLPDNR
jgi:hypothetical protein